ncbi:MAG TPA: DUF4365 domain-containing protein [Tepidisphaeraceae bacterium]|jgi:hypothetical protein
MPAAQAFPLMSCGFNCTFSPLAGLAENLAKEDLSIAFINAIAAQSGLQTEHPFKHDDGIDLRMGCTSAVVPGVRRRNPQIFIQMKATSHPEISEEAIVFRFGKRERYLHLIDGSTVPQALVVYVMPDDRAKWVVPVDNHLDIHGHAFFINMADAPPIGPDDPPKVVIPLANRLTSESLIRFFCESVVRHYRPDLRSPDVA